MLREPWRIELLGRILLRCGDEVCTRFRERKIVSLLALLALQQEHVLTREQLMEYLWPEEVPELARNRFRVTLYHLRHLLEPFGVEPGSVLQTGRIEIALRPTAIVCDAADFLTAWHAAEKCSESIARVQFLEQAVALYHGDFLPGFEDEWALDERERFAQLFFQALRGLTRLLLMAGNAERALPYARQAVTREPFEEEARLDLMRVYEAAGQITEALREYEQFESLLARELDAPPASDTQQFALQLRTRIGHPLKTHLPAPRSIPTPDVIPDMPSTASASASRLLPPRLTRFFGREEEISALSALLSPAAPDRLVSLLGPGGVGKTRLAVEVAERMLADYPGRVYFVPAADLFSVQQMGEALLAALRRRPTDGTEPLSLALALLGEAPALLVLDNLEHLLPEMGPLITQMLTDLDSLRILVTSRRSVGVEGEQEYGIAPLPLPKHHTPPTELGRFPAIALLVDRMRAARVDFALTERNAADVVWLCQRLEGLPLALELAAARIRVMSVKEMRAQMDAMLEWLVDVRGGKETRHRSLRTAIAWSHRLLPPRLQRCFHALSVFSGGFTAEAATAVGGEMFASHSDLLGMLDELCSASLLIGREDAQGQMRFGMLESLRAFGLEQLQNSGSETELRQRHLRWIVERAEQSDFWDTDSLRVMAEDDANLRSALSFGLSEEAEQALTLRLAASLQDYWIARGSLSEGRDWLRRALVLSASEETKAGARIAAARLAIQQGDYAEADILAQEGLVHALAREEQEAIAGNLVNLGLVAFRQGDYQTAYAKLDEALSYYRSPEAARQRAECLMSLGMVAWYQADHATARARLEEALAMQRARGSERGIADCLLKLGNVVRDLGDLAEGCPLLEMALQTFQQIGAPHGIATALHDLGLIALFQGDLAQGKTYFQEALKHFREVGARQGCAACCHNLGEILLTEGPLEEGRAFLQEAQDIYRQMGDWRGIAVSLHAFGEVAERQGQWTQAAGLLREALEIDRRIGNRQGVAQDLSRLALILIAQGEYDQAQAHLQEALAINGSIPSIGEIARTLVCCAILTSHRGQARRAARLAGAAEALLRSKGLSALSEEKLRLQTLRATLCREMGKAALEEAWRAGAMLSLEAAVQETAQIGEAVSRG
jgi:predicted ATPase/DNA-binding SARP family transcriptional activator/Tfp pilus assembly protein PilF